MLFGVSASLYWGMIVVTFGILEQDSTITWRQITILLKDNAFLSLWPYHWTLDNGPNYHTILSDDWAGHHQLDVIYPTKPPSIMDTAAISHQMQVVYTWLGPSRSEGHKQVLWSRWSGTYGSYLCYNDLCFQVGIYDLMECTLWSFDWGIEN